MSNSSLQKELGKKRPFDVAEVEASLNVLKTADFLTRQFAEVFETTGLTAPQYNVLRILRGHGGEGLPCQEIAGQMITRTPDITRLVDRLETAGLIERARTTADRRVVLVRITSAGTSLLAKLDKPVMETHKNVLKNLSAHELSELNRVLLKIRTALEPG